MKEKIIISVCILSHNRKLEVAKSIQLIKKNNYKNYEIILVDNASTDGTDTFIQKKFPEVIFIRNKNEGIAGWNVAFKRAKGEILLVLDDDAHPGINTLSQIEQEFYKNPKLDFMACNVMNITAKMGLTFSFSSLKNKKPQKVYNFMGCGAAFRRKSCKKVGYFADWMFLYVHEIEFSLRALKKGYDIWFYPEIVIYHRESPMVRTNKRFLYYCTRNFLILSWIHFPFVYALGFTFFIFVQSFFTSLKNKELKTFFKAFISFLQNIPLISRKRDPLSYKKLYPFAVQYVGRIFGRSYF